MSIYNEKYDAALSRAPWVAKPAGGRPYLLKYAPHPDRAGYVFVATDLETVHFEALTAAAVPARLLEAATRTGDSSAPSPSASLDAEQKQAEDALAQLADVFDSGLAGVTVSAERDDYYDLVLVLRAPDFGWVFNLTEMRGRQPLTFLARQMIAPFAALIADDRGVHINDNPAEAASTIVADPGVARALRRIAGVPPPSRLVSQRTSAVPGTPRSPDATPRPVTPTRPTGPAHGHPPPPSPTPYKKPGPGPALVPSSSSSRAASPSRARRPQTLMTDFSIPPSSPPRGVPSGDAPSSEVPASTSDVPSSQLPMSTLDPLLPSQADGERPRRKRKKDKEAEAAAEEAEADRRREEMKRKMKTGTPKKAGAGLGRRRF